MRVFKYTGLLLCAGILGWFGSLAVEFATMPTTPSLDSYVSFKARTAVVVDRQWNRPEAVPTAEDHQSYLLLIDEGIALSAQATDAAIAKARAALNEADKLFAVRMRRTLALNAWLEPRFAALIADVVPTITLWPSVLVASQRAEAVERQLFALLAARHSLSDARHHLAMALIFAGNDAGAIEQLRAVIRENPSYALTNGTYMIGGRSGAENDPNFCSEFAAIGGNVERLKLDYTGDKASKLYPFITLAVQTSHKPR